MSIISYGLDNSFSNTIMENEGIAVVGESQNTARYAGINVKKVIIRTMMLSLSLIHI